MTVLCGEDDYIEPLSTLPITLIILPISRRGMSFQDNFKTLVHLRKILKSNNWDAVQATTIKPNILSSIAVIGLNLKLFTMITGLGVVKDTKFRGFKYFMFMFMFRFVNMKSKKVFVQGRTNIDWVISNQYISDNKIVKISGSGVDTSYFQAAPMPPTSNGIRLLYIGRLLRSKGLLDLINLTNLAHKNGRSVSLTIAGRTESGFVDAIPKVELAQACTPSYIKYEGEVLDVRPLIESTHAVVLLTKYGEGVPKSVLEASSMNSCLLYTSDAADE